jgi:hypothetical protein
MGLRCEVNKKCDVKSNRKGGLVLEHQGVDFLMPIVVRINL